MALLGCQAIPPHRLGTVLRHAITVVVHAAEAVLGTGIALLGGQPIPLHRLDAVLRHTFAIAVPISKPVQDLSGVCGKRTEGVVQDRAEEVRW
jgi:hypothetical protein